MISYDLGIHTDDFSGTQVWLREDGVLVDTAGVLIPATDYLRAAVRDATRSEVEAAPDGPLAAAVRRFEAGANPAPRTWREDR